MNPLLQQILLPIITGGFGVWLGHWLKWDFEKKKLRYEERKQFIKTIRDEVIKTDFYLLRFYNSILYSQLRPYLTKKLIKEFETHALPKKSRTLEVGDNFRITNEQQLLDVIQELERKWGLL